jgi:hypothetical protein
MNNFRENPTFNQVDYYKASIQTKSAVFDILAMILQPSGIMLRIFSNKNSKPGHDAMRCKKKFLHYFKKGFMIHFM